MLITDFMEPVGPERWGLAALALLLWLAVCLWAWCVHRRDAAGKAPTVLVAYASQSGNAEALARATLTQIQGLGGSGCKAGLLPLNAVTLGDLRRSQYLMLIVSTTGQGVAPDNARQFVQRLMGRSYDLGHLRYAVLGLGDRRYKQFCGFASAVATWLADQGAVEVCAILKSDRNDPRVLEQWQQTVGNLVAPSVPAGQPEVAVPINPT